MYFASFSELLAMNGHGAYVWSAYGIGFVVLAVLILRPLLRHAALSRQILRQTDRE